MVNSVFPIALQLRQLTPAHLSTDKELASGSGQRHIQQPGLLVEGLLFFDGANHGVSLRTIVYARIVRIFYPEFLPVNGGILLALQVSAA